MEHPFRCRLRCVTQQQKTYKKQTLLKNNQAFLSDEIKIEQKIIDLGLQFENMLESIECNKSPLNSFEEAWENFIVISAIEKSLREGRVISIN